MVSIPLSYGSSLTEFGGRCGARKRERNSGITGKMTATTRKRAIGPNVPSTCDQYTQGDRSAVHVLGHTCRGERGVAVGGGKARLCGRDVCANCAAVRPDELVDDVRPGRAMATH